MSGKRARGHIPHRDRASQALMKRAHDAETSVQELEVASQCTQKEPEREPDKAESEALGLDLPDIMDDADEGEEEEAGERQHYPVDEIDLPDTTYPSLDEYKAKWDGLLAAHSKPVPGVFSHVNLVPEPLPALWQDCPYVPLINCRATMPSQGCLGAGPSMVSHPLILMMDTLLTRITRAR